jgi:Flp pilus assembly pilin Flp
MRELTSVELEAVSGGATAVEYGLLAALVAEAALEGLQNAAGNLPQ